MSRGRKSAWETTIKPQLNRIIPLRRQGLTEEQIAKVLGIGYGTLKDNKSTHPELSAALKKGKEVLVEELEDTLYTKALGRCKTKSTKKYIEQQADGSQKTKIEETINELAPDTGCLCFALKNLAPDRWKDVRLDNNDFLEMQKALDNFKSLSEGVNSFSRKDLEDVQENDPTI